LHLLVHSHLAQLHSVLQSAQANGEKRATGERPVVENSAIEWCDHTFNPWEGCVRVSPGCDHCYAETRARRFGNGALWEGERRRTSPSYWQQPRKWNRRAADAGVRQTVFCASLADAFDNGAPAFAREDLFALQRQTSSLDWLMLTKRPENITRMLPKDWGDGYRNVALGVSVENQEEADRRIPLLLANPAAMRFLSIEPLLGPVNLRRLDIDGDGEIDCLRPATEREIWDDAWAPDATGMSLEEAIEGWEDAGGTYPPSEARKRGIDWVIVGGESGPGARPMNPEWARALRDQCQAAGVAFFMKQMGGVIKSQMPPIPGDLMIREFPTWAR